MPKVIEVIYENGVFKPLEKVDLPEDVRVKIRIEKERGVITTEFLNGLKKIKFLPKVKIDLKNFESYT